MPVFRPLHPATVEAGAVVTGAAPAISQELQHSPATTRAERGTLSLGWLAAGILLVLLIAVLARRGVTAFDAAGASSTSSIWPYSALTANGQAVTIVMSDNSFAFFQVAAKRRFHLADYLKTNYPANLSPYLGALASPPLADFTDQLGRKQVTSYADSAIVGAMARFRLATPWLIRPCRDIKAREIQDGSYVLLGSTYSNPWVELYESRLNFVVAPDDPLRFVNRKPLAGESSSYIVQGITGNSGDDYAAIAVIPNEKRGAVLLIQGAKEEGTEAAGLFMADPNACQALQLRLGIKPSEGDHTWFEALLKTKTLAGASASTEIVAVRRLPDTK